MSDLPSRRIGYLVNSYPVLSETFIRNEIRAVRDAGIDVAVFRLEPPSRRQPVEADSDVAVVDLSPRTIGRGGLLVAHLAHLCRRPKEYLSVLRRGVLVYLKRYLIERTERRRRALRKRTRRFSRAVCLAREARRRGVVHLHAHYAKEPLETAELVRRLEGTPYSLAAHAKDLYTVPEQRLTRRLRRARFAVACHPHGAQRLRELRPRRGARILHVPHGLDTDLFRPLAGRRQRDLILAVGRLTPKKGFEHLLRACAVLRRQGRQLRCVLIGNGRCHSRLARLRDELDLGNVVELRKSVPQTDLPRWYRRATVFAMPAQVLEDGNRDGIPNVLLEAMACAAPIVATRVSSIPHAVEHGRTGLLVPAGDPFALASAIRRLLDDPRFAAELGRKAAGRVAELDYRDTNRRLIDEFRPLVATSAEAAFSRVEKRAFENGGVATKAARRLGVEPRPDPRAEAIIRAAVAPGIRANAWRPDLDRLVERRLWDEVVKARRVDGLLRALDIDAPRARILDLGSGRGGLSVALAARGHRITSVDLRYRNCLVTRLRGRRYGLDVPATTSIGEQLPFPKATFDAVACLEVLEHVLDPVALLTEIRRVLRPGGGCVLTVINRWAHLDPHYRLWGLNFLPPGLANRYIALRRRTKESYRDLQTLDEMHYYRFGEFVRLAHRLGFSVEDPERPDGRLASRLHDLKRKTSLGFNTAVVVVRPAGRLRHFTPRSERPSEPRAAAAR